MKKTLKQIRDEATQKAREMALREANDPKLKEAMDKLRAAEDRFYAEATQT